MIDPSPEQIAAELIAAIDEYLQSTDPGNQPPARCSGCGFAFKPASIFSSQPSGIGWRCERCGGSCYVCTVTTNTPSADPRILLKEAAAMLRLARPPVDPRPRFGTLTLGGEWADGARPFYFRATGDDGPVEPAGQVQGAEAAAALGEAFGRFNAQGVGETRPEIAGK